MGGSIKVQILQNFEDHQGLPSVYSDIGASRQTVCISDSGCGAAGILRTGKEIYVGFAWQGFGRGWAASVKSC